MSIRPVRLPYIPILPPRTPSQIRLNCIRPRYLAYESLSKRAIPSPLPSCHLLSDSSHVKIVYIKMSIRGINMGKYLSPRQKEYENYLDRENSRLEQGLPALGPKKAMSALSKEKIPKIDLNVHSESYVKVECEVGNIHLKSHAPGFSFYVVLNDEKGVGSFYAGDTNQTPRIVDCLQIYNTADLLDKDKPHLFEIFWSKDGQKAALRIDQYFHAVFDFDEKRGYCRTNFPPSNPSSLFGEYSHEWDDDCLKWFRA